MAFTVTSRVHVYKDAQNHIRAMEHIWEPYLRPQLNLRELAHDYLVDVLETYDIQSEVVDPILPDLFTLLGTTITSDLTDVRIMGENATLGMNNFTFVQTHFSLPVWESGITLTILEDPIRVTGSASTFHLGGTYQTPSDDPPCTADKISEPAFKNLLGTAVNTHPDLQKGLDRLRIVDDPRMWVYQYDRNARYYPKPSNGPIPDDYGSQSDDPLHESPPTLPLPSVPASIVDQKHYVVSEVLFTLALPDLGEITWRAFVEVDTCAILYLRALVSAATGKSFVTDPVSDTGHTFMPAELVPATLDSAVYSRASIVTFDTTIATSLDGPYVSLANPVQSKYVAPACEFDFQPSTESLKFSSVNGYFHVDSAFKMIDELWALIKPGAGSYFYNKRHNLPVEVKIEQTLFDAKTFANGNSNPGVAQFMLGRTNMTNYLSNATSKRVVLHEFGHALLLESTRAMNFDFAHSAGDGMSAIVCDPGSKAPYGVTFPWAQLSPWIAPKDQRHHDRNVADGWAWHGSNDQGISKSLQYGSEQILSTTLFHAYRSAGGAATSLNPAVQLATRRFASDFLTYLIVSTIGRLGLSWAVPMQYPEQFEHQLAHSDNALPGLPNHARGAFNKVIRWVFEKQGMFKIPPVLNVDAEGDPPLVDVYINDGRDGEYEYQYNFWNSPDIWNRHTTDGQLSHQTPIPNQPNHIYVRIKNRGSNAAQHVRLRVFSAYPGTGLVWNTTSQYQGWKALTPGSVTLPGSISANGEVIVGPITWTPTHLWHECLLAVVSDIADPSNVDTIVIPANPVNLPGATLQPPQWQVKLPCATLPTPLSQLVPFDNNIAQRNVVPVPTGKGGLNLVLAFNRRTFRAHNPYERRATIVIEWTLPYFLQERGWEMELTNRGRAAFTLGPNRYRDVVTRLRPGKQFTRRDVEASGVEPVIEFRALIDGLIVGGMTYVIDPYMRVPSFWRDGSRNGVGADEAPSVKGK